MVATNPEQSAGLTRNKRTQRALRSKPQAILQKPNLSLSRKLLNIQKSTCTLLIPSSCIPVEQQPASFLRKMCANRLYHTVSFLRLTNQTTIPKETPFEERSTVHRRSAAKLYAAHLRESCSGAQVPPDSQALQAIRGSPLGGNIIKNDWRKSSTAYTRR